MNTLSLHNANTQRTSVQSGGTRYVIASNTTPQIRRDLVLGCTEEFEEDNLPTSSSETLPGLCSFSKENACLLVDYKPPNRFRTELAAEDVKLVNELGRLTPDQLAMYMKNMHNTALVLSLEEKKQCSKGRFLNIFAGTNDGNGINLEIQSIMSFASSSSSIRDLVVPKNSDYSTPVAPRKLTGKCRCVAELLNRITVLRRETTALDGEFSLVNNNDIQWSKLFMEFILGSAYCEAPKCSAQSDDMIWYVPLQRMHASFNIGVAPQLQVYRRQSKKQPAPCDSGINWEETVCLNLILQQLDFYVTCAVCTKTSPQNLQIIRKNCQRVYPSPSRRRMDSKGEAEEITYPKIYFAIDGFEEVFNDVVVRDGECVCVELVAKDRQKTHEAVIFLGSIRYEVLKQVYDAKASSTWQWAQRLMREDRRRQEFVRMRGPRGKGYAEMAVARVPGCGMETPLADNQMDFSDFANFEHQMGKRRMSENNLTGQPTVTMGRSAMTPSAGGPSGSRSRRWQSEADSVNQYPEVEASSIDDELDEGVLSRLWSVRGFGQAWHWLREKKRAECTPLNAYLTYVTLPWTAILDDLLAVRPKRPILTFEFDSPTPT